MACVAWVEVDAFMQGITWAKNKNLTKFIIEGDCVDVINRIVKHREDVTLTGHLLHECKSSLADLRAT